MMHDGDLYHSAKTLANCFCIGAAKPSRIIRL